VAEENGWETFTETFTVRIRPGLTQKIAARAQRHRRSRNAEINMLLEVAVDLADARDRRVDEIEPLTT
jgi:hypothetical protein